MALMKCTVSIHPYYPAEAGLFTHLPLGIYRARPPRNKRTRPLRIAVLQVSTLNRDRARLRLKPDLRSLTRVDLLPKVRGFLLTRALNTIASAYLALND